jgi:uncharacterized membrane protein
MSSYEHDVADVVKTVEAIGALIMVVGALVSFVVFAIAAWSPRTRPGTYNALRRNLGRSILIGLEVLILADIVRTIIVAPTLTSVAVLGGIVLIRVILSFSLEVEIDGVWPWSRWRTGETKSRPEAGR